MRPEGSSRRSARSEGPGGGGRWRCGLARARRPSGQRMWPRTWPQRGATVPAPPPAQRHWRRACGRSSTELVCQTLSSCSDVEHTLSTGVERSIHLSSSLLSLTLSLTLIPCITLTRWLGAQPEWRDDARADHTRVPREGADRAAVTACVRLRTPAPAPVHQCAGVRRRTHAVAAARSARSRRAARWLSAPDPSRAPPHGAALRQAPRRRAPAARGPAAAVLHHPPGRPSRRWSARRRFLGAVLAPD